MRRYPYRWCDKWGVVFSCILVCCCYTICISCSDHKKRVSDSVNEKVVRKFSSEWRTHKWLHIPRESVETSQLIDEDLSIMVAGIELMFVRVGKVDSAQMESARWEKLIESDPTSLSLDQAIDRKLLLGGSGEIYPFSGIDGNFGYLIVDTEIGVTWCRIWSSDRKLTSHVRVTHSVVDSNKCKSICHTLAQMKWANAM